MVATNTSVTELDLDKALEVELPADTSTLTPARFRTSDGKGGWQVHIPGRFPIATPAYADGLLFVGGGYGSYAFYAFDAATGELAWKLDTSDDGPTAAVAADGLVAFNTESCTIYVCEARSGKVVWEEWLGDPLMSQPAIDNGRLFIAYPADQSKPLFRPGMSVDEKRTASETARAHKGDRWEHRLLCTDLRKGTHLWEQAITGDVISAPVVADGKVYLTCFDGVSFCLDANNGDVVWKKDDGATTAPLVVGDQVIHGEKRVYKGRTSEGLRRKVSSSGLHRHAALHSEAPAEYLSQAKSGGVGIKAAAQASLDASVGFSVPPSSAKLKAASSHVGTSSVAAAWAYQGSRPASAKGRILNAAGSSINCLRSDDGAAVWQSKSRSRHFDEGDQFFLPPALGRERMYLLSTAGHVVSVRQDDGSVGFMYHVKQPIAFQPALAGGRVYFGTATGRLVCLDTGDADADDWPMWGGNAQHNKTQV